MTKRSYLELQMEAQIRDSGLPSPQIEYHFHPTRDWRFDFAWPDIKLALEVEGGIYNGGRHVTPKGFEGDCEKYNEATCLDWRVIRVTSKMINSSELKALTLITRMIRLLSHESNSKNTNGRPRTIRRSSKSKSDRISVVETQDK